MKDSFVNIITKMFVRTEMSMLIQLASASSSR